MHTIACKVLVNGKVLVYSHFSVVFLSCKWKGYLAGFHKSTVIQNAIKKGVTSNTSPDSLASREGV